MTRLRGLLVTVIALPRLLPSVAAAQPLDIYRFVLGVDVPEPAVFAGFGIGPPVRLGSAPKPIAGAVLLTSSASSTVRAAAVDFSPYWLASGGTRDLVSYRSRSVAGRLTRVLMKTVLSLGAMKASDEPTSMMVGIGVRSTLHDPHDPVLNSRLPEEAAAARDGDLATIRARARHAMRARSWDPQVSAGWVVATRAAGGVLTGDSLDATRHTLWLAAQLTTGARFDLMGFAELQDTFGDESAFAGGLGLRRKSDMGDVQAGLAWHGRTRTVHPAITLDARLGATLGALLWIDTRPAPGPSPKPALRFGVLARWFFATDAA
jgi:hypothetical protein